jgi:hypothetical protein
LQKLHHAVDELVSTTGHIRPIVAAAATRLGDGMTPHKTTIMPWATTSQVTTLVTTIHLQNDARRPRNTVFSKRHRTTTSCYRHHTTNNIHLAKPRYHLEP